MLACLLASVGRRLPASQRASLLSRGELGGSFHERLTHVRQSSHPEFCEVLRSSAGSRLRKFRTRWVTRADVRGSGFAVSTTRRTKWGSGLGGVSKERWQPPHTLSYRVGGQKRGETGRGGWIRRERRPELKLHDATEPSGEKGTHIDDGIATGFIDSLRSCLLTRQTTQETTLQWNCPPMGLPSTEGLHCPC